MKDLAALISDENMKDDIETNHNMVDRRVQIQIVVKLCKYLLICLMIAYFAGIVWFIAIEYQPHKDGWWGEMGAQTAREKYWSPGSTAGEEAMEFTSSVALVKITYFAMTTLTTVGLGDIAP